MENRDSKGRFLKGHTPLNYSGGKPKCIDCGKQLSSYGATRCKKCSNKLMIGKKYPPRSIESRKKYSLAKLGKKRLDITGKNHPRWINDRTKLKRKDERNDTAYQDWRKQVLERDNYKCKICGEKYTKEHKLVVHHILSWKDYPEERYNINNGITLCHYHHPRKREDEERLIPYFQSLVGSYEQ